MTCTISYFVDGAARPGNGGRTARVMNPSTGQEQARAELASTDEVNEVIANAEKAQVGWAKTNAQKRIRVIMQSSRSVRRTSSRASSPTPSAPASTRAPCASRSASSPASPRPTSPP